MSEELEIHPTHLPEPEDSKLFTEFGHIVCMRCCYFIKLQKVTPRGAAECKPVKIGLRDLPGGFVMWTYDKS